MINLILIIYQIQIWIQRNHINSILKKIITNPKKKKKNDKFDFMPIKGLINQNFEEMSQSQDISKLKKLLKQIVFQTYKKNDLPW